MSTVRLLRLSASALFALPLIASAGVESYDPDPSFGDGNPSRPGTVIRGFNNGFKDDAASALLQDAQGRIIAVGPGSTSGNDSCIGLMRFSANGALDESNFGFDQNNIARGKICHAHLPEAGSQIETTANNQALNAVIQPDGKLVVGGVAWSPTTNGVRNFICRFLPDGRIDSSFSPEGTPGCLTDSGDPYYFPRIVIDASHLLMISHLVDPAGPTYQMRLQRYSLADGSAELFGQDASVTLVKDDAGLVRPIAVDVLLTTAGNAAVAIDSESGRFVVGMFDPETGTPVTGFNGTGTLLVEIDAIPDGFDTATFLENLPGDRLLVGGMVEQVDGFSGIALVQVSADTGAPDMSFNAGSPLLYSPCIQIGGCDIESLQSARSSEGNIVVGGVFDPGAGPYSTLSMKIRPDGSLDTAFGILDGFNLVFGRELGAILLMQDERVVLGGVATSVGTVFVDEDNDGIDEIKQIEHDDFILMRLRDGILFKDAFEGASP